jgi:outer membrane receptor protein involved in Fe transport
MDAVVVLEQAEAEPAVETVVEVESASVQSLLLERQRGIASGDSVGRAEITKANDRTAAEAAKRVVGANIEGSRFLFVRGLGERYTNALLDGFPLPSPEPDRQAVPLDLFPSQILDSLTVVKTFSPDVPGDFAGGSVRIATRRIPNKLTLAGSVSVGFNTEATFSNALTHAGGGLDFLGIDDGTRALPTDIPSTKVVRGVEQEDGTIITRDEIAAFGREMNTPLSARRSLGAPNLSVNAVAADSFSLGDWGKLGIMGALVYDRRLERVVEAKLRTYGRAVGEESDSVRLLNDLELERATQLVSWGGLFGTTLELGEDHRLGLTGLYTRAADISTSVLSGRHEERASSLAEERLTFVSRQLAFGDITGHHRFKEANGLELDYGLGLARATREQPDTRGATYQYDATQNVFAFEDDSTSGSHFFSEQGETTVSGMVDITVPLLKRQEVAKIKTGAAFNLRDREFLARRFRFRPDRKNGAEGFDLCPGASFSLDCPDKLFTDANIDSRALELEENTGDNDGYNAGLQVVSTYVMLDTRPLPHWRLTLGPRLEVSSQDITSFDPVDSTQEAKENVLEDLQLLPAALLTYTPIPKANLRLSVTRTVARPQLRELAPFGFVDYFGGRETRGNPEIVNTSIVNADTRFEFFPTSREVIAVSAFYKQFENPIEQVIQASSGTAGVVTFDNAPSGNLFGIELEARKSLDFLSEALRPLSIISNVTLAHSSVQLDAERAILLTSKSRPLSQQAPFIVNVALDFDYEPWGTRARLLYNVVGQRLTQVGRNGIPDIYELPRHVLDLTVGQKLGQFVELRGSASNLLDWPTVREHKTGNGDITEEFKTGTTFSLGLALAN